MKRGGQALLGSLVCFFLLFCGLYGALFGFAGAFGLPANYDVLFFSCLWISAFFTLLYALPPLWLRSLVLLAVVILATLWAKRHLSALVTGLLACSQQVAALFSQSFPYLTPLQGLGVADGPLREGVTAIFQLVMVALGGLLGWAVAKRHSFWLSLCLTAPFLVPCLLITITPPWQALTLLLLCYGLLLLTRLTPPGDRWGRTKLLLVSTPLALALLLGIGLAVPRADYVRSPALEQQRVALEDWAYRVAQRFVQEEEGLPGGVLSGQADGKVDLAQAGPLRYTGRTALRVESETTGHIFLRGASGGVYTGTGWQPLPEQLYARYARDVNPLNFPSLTASGGKARRVRVVVENVAADRGYVYTPYQLITTPERMSGAAFVQDAFVTPTADVRKYLLYAREDASPLTSSGPSGQAGQAEALYQQQFLHPYTDITALDSGVYHAFEQYLAEHPLPPRDEFVRGEVMDTNGLIPTAASPQNQLARERMACVQQVIDFLHAGAVYDPETPATPAGQDFIATFLLERRAGYCTHFASAATLLLRQLGIPARFVTGYVVDTVAGETVDVPDYNAHAWVEVYFDRYGWQPIEVTPSFSGDFPWTQQETPTPTPAPTPAPTQGATVPTPKPTPAPTPAPPASQPPPRLAASPWLLLPLGLGLVTLALALRRSLAQRRRQKAFAQSNPNGAVLALYRYREALAAHGGPAMDEAVLALAQKAKFSQHTITAAERAAAQQGVLATARALDGALPLHRKLLLRYLWGLY